MICTLIPQPRGLTTRGDLIKKSFDIHSPSLFFSSAHFILRKACAPPDLPPLASGLNSGKSATQEMWIQGKKKPPFQGLRDPFSTNYSKVWSRHQIPEPVRMGQGPKLQGPLLLCFLKYFSFYCFLSHILHEDPYASQTMRQNIVWKMDSLLQRHTT